MVYFMENPNLKWMICGTPAFGQGVKDPIKLVGNLGCSLPPASLVGTSEILQS